MAAAVQYGSQPFKEQIEFFRGKVNLPTRTWLDLWQGEHARGFVIAGAMKDELVSDFRSAIDKAISQGTTLAEFRKDFDKIVAAHGWEYKGGRGWRTRVIYDTNLRASYNAGRYAQMQRVKQSRPYWEYVHSDGVEHPREDHLAWDGTVLPADHSWFLTHFTPNGWGCKCRIVTRSRRDLVRMGKSVSDPPPMQWEERKVGDKTVRVPKGIDPGWAYNPGRVAWGQQSTEKLIAEHAGGKQWTPLTGGDYLSYGRPDRVPVATPTAKRGPMAANKDAAVSAIKQAINGDLKVFETRVKDFTYPVYVDAQVLGDHLALDRTPYIPLLPELLENPYEIWQAFEEHAVTGKVVLRHRYIKAVDIGGGKALTLVADAQAGKMIGWTFFHGDKIAGLNRLRKGKLVYGAKD